MSPLATIEAAPESSNVGIPLLFGVDGEVILRIIGLPFPMTPSIDFRPDQQRIRYSNACKGLERADIIVGMLSIYALFTHDFLETYTKAAVQRVKIYLVFI